MGKLVYQHQLVRNAFVVGLSLFASGCAADLAPLSTEPNPFIGHFASPCTDAGGGLYLSFDTVHTQDTSRLTISYYSDAGASTCSDASRLMRLEKTYSTVIGADYSASITSPGQVARKVDLTAQSVYLTAYNNGTTDLVASMNGNGNCSALDTFVSGVAQEVSGSQCGADGGTHPTVGQKEYSFFDLHTDVTPNEFYVGDSAADAGLDETSDAKRSISKLGIALLKI